MGSGISVYKLMGSRGVVDVHFVVRADSNAAGASSYIHSVNRARVKMGHGDAARTGCG